MARSHRTNAWSIYQRKSLEHRCIKAETGAPLGYSAAEEEEEEECCYAIGSVSYTHLDVYKRQVHKICWFW